MLDDDINPYISNYKTKIINNKKQITELISPINYSWKQLFKMMNKIKILWRMDKFDINFSTDIYSPNVKYFIEEYSRTLPTDIGFTYYFVFINTVT